MRFGSEELDGVLTGSFDYHWEADLHYDGVRRLAAIPITEPDLNENAGSKVQQSGSVTVVWQDEFATSITPREITDPLAPFGAQLRVFCVVTAGTFRERVEYGWFEITDVPSARDEQMQWRGEWLTTGSVVSLELAEITDGIGHESFDVPTAPESLTSTWGEVRRITGVPILRSVEDVPITRSIMYPESKLDAVYELMDVMLDATPHVTAFGALSARPNVWPEPVASISRDCLVSVVHSMSPERVYNRVVVRSRSGDQTAVLAVAEITTGRLRVRNRDGSRSPFGARTYYLSSEFVTTAGQAQPWAEATLRQVSTIRTRTAVVVETFNPLRERGDVVLIERPTVWLLVRVVEISRTSKATQTLRVEVGGSQPKTDTESPFDAFYGPPGLYPTEELFPSDDLFPEV